MRRAPEDLRAKMFQGIRDLDERISDEDIDLLWKKQAMKELLKKSRCSEVERDWRETVVAGGVVTWMATAGPRSSGTEADLLVSEVGRLTSSFVCFSLADVHFVLFQPSSSSVPAFLPTHC